MIRDDIHDAMIAAMRARDKESLGAFRLIQSAIKNRDIEARMEPAFRDGPRSDKDDDALVVGVLQGMVKQRRDSITMYRQGGREELAAAEEAEVAIIERFLPVPLSEDETKAAIEAIKVELGASGMKDMGNVMATLKARHGMQLDMSKASRLVKAALS
ncbi:GatB/YqeY domain-containing protein [Sphingomonas suaedae]|uniref:GatB/YqeY domain-containing protein n=1 Tax=Sphingomonas suaedae TaxID=2599297 RepID=A0A518RBX7_9SPHN|nr:GatB/YqeY domain-containing protein [Sphingomonas suaedae]QDX24970.1 GatB/YqeY domain-containing protein [Sphingomonas suaedae]